MAMNEFFNSRFKKITLRRCRTCTTAASSYLSLQEKINDKSKTYDELLKDLLQVKRIIPFENLLPQNICKKCASFLKNIYTFLLEARKRHEELLQYMQNSDNESCLPEMCNELPKMQEMQVKIEATKIESSTNMSDLTQSLAADQTECMLLKPVEAKIKTELEVLDSATLPLEDGGENNDLSDNDCNAEGYNESDQSDMNSTCTDTSDAFSIAQDGNLLNNSLVLSCNICGKIYSKAAALKRHKSYSHIQEDEKTCSTLCTFRTGDMANLNDHLRTLHAKSVTTHSTRIFCCTLCPKRYSRKNDLQRHMTKAHLSKERYKSSHLCSFCGKSCINKQKLMIHVRIHTGDRPFKCDFCEKAFRSSESLKYHLITHSDEKPHACSECGKSFKHKDKLRAHMRLHSVDKPFKCELCEKAFRRSESLKYHLVEYHNERPHICSECGKSFKKKDNLHVHMRVHSGLRPYTCNVCERTFKYLSGLKSHMPVHTGQKPFSCKSCNKSFARKTNLSAHCKKNGHEN
uniref:Uncharacterized protein n=1 Tax=Glossina morsitans morsitans TaxID=37546 RepID=A0A1B0FKU2_GLOMM